MSRPRTTWTEEAKADFLKYLAQTNLIGRSAKLAGVSRRSVELERRENEEFEAAVQDALADYAELVESEVDRRGRIGTYKGIWQQGRKCGIERVYSDKLLELQAKATNPKYREKGIEIGVQKGGVLVVEAPVTDLEKWREDANAEYEKEMDDDAEHSG